MDKIRIDYTGSLLLPIDEENLSLMTLEQEDSLKEYVEFMLLDTLNERQREQAKVYNVSVSVTIEEDRSEVEEYE